MDIPQTAISLTGYRALLVIKVLVLIAIDVIAKQIVLPEDVVVNERTALDNGTCINQYCLYNKKIKSIIVRMCYCDTNFFL